MEKSGLKSLDRNDLPAVERSTLVEKIVSALLHGQELLIQEEMEGDNTV
jgi:hypothetical protein